MSSTPEQKHYKILRIGKETKLKKKRFFSFLRAGQLLIAFINIEITQDSSNNQNHPAFFVHAQIKLRTKIQISSTKFRIITIIFCMVFKCIDQMECYSDNTIIWC